MSVQPPRGVTIGHPLSRAVVRRGPMKNLVLVVWSGVGVASSGERSGAGLSLLQVVVRARFVAGGNAVKGVA